MTKNNFNSSVLDEMLKDMTTPEMSRDVARSLSYHLYTAIHGTESKETRHHLIGAAKDMLSSVKYKSDNRQHIEDVLINTDAVLKFLRPHLIYNEKYMPFVKTAKPELGFNIDRRHELIKGIDEHLKPHSKKLDAVHVLERSLAGVCNDNLKYMCIYNGVTEKYVKDLLKRGSGLLYGNIYPSIVLTGGWDMLAAKVEELDHPRQLLVKHANRIFVMQAPNMYAEIYPIAYQIRCPITPVNLKRWSGFLCPKSDDNFEKIYTRLSGSLKAMSLLVSKERRVLEKDTLEKVITPMKMKGTWTNTIVEREIAKLINYVLFTPNPESLEDKVNWIRSEDFLKACIMQARKKLRQVAVELKGNKVQVKANRLNNKEETQVVNRHAKVKRKKFW